ncbi:tRNA (adenosine(37)-N6)-dimethylallyltransferase MiaA [Halalkalibacterium halodurans]|uniref:tRNA dimethylallyltransferase n=2 Tax=Halalkalibacterium halodurans (strain ATCC BAA-125 / DSM 18197 / FERM 7344 / JCM 9153 / C-125) TaxID=272558 RepID=MIAA_HALH5|nr:tRNA (adenosine(37)-N6)-dimethylallyltransferase MiaA [Halalkalibacterium halodurans]Q9KAC3.1 RecName: Full=tRNA dimethylallyltransferase; AltName: Full=Dimethylallyl diphosphate:tRNA dimethylallyltransferase; Short=DMAPP:tRNA dimethylallyltransferase; Short=DMATase; AltName: Full=Isopentenyl-diphosphate:tRNA isopentenyltransferase; Short=IPP transferase; Short=IPPT; Short=IPTase [Halalkalibacterium halodurans C-125]MED4081194.1 tRNA (adenosine(37)-N6)-dimethylallyltransferase MiaA [Halalkalib
MKEKLVAIVGPTAVGKTKTSVMLAKRLNGEVISGDSMQVYRGMDIGTAKITAEEMDGVPHHLIDIKDPSESFSVADFQDLATPLITEIHERGRLPFLVGGTGLYVNAVIHQFNLGDIRADEDYRHELEAFVNSYGVQALHDKLSKIDPKAAAAIHPNNYRRVIRALEIIKLTGKTVTEQARHEEETPSPYNLVMIGLTMERDVLYDRINRRVDQMVEEGLIDEAKKLYDRGIRDCQSVQAIGYKEMYDYLDGNVTLEEAIDTLKRNSRRYAKRQLTWFRNKANVTWFDMTDVDFDKKIMEIHNFIAGKLEEKSK